jgi:hypothetical protein
MSKSITTVSKISIGGKELWFPSPVDAGKYETEVPLVSTHGTVKKYPLGTKLETADGRVFRYIYASGTCYPQLGAYKSKLTNTVTTAPTQKTAAEMVASYPGETLASGAVGSEYVAVTIDTEIGVLTTGVLSANELEGGYIVVGNGSGQAPQNRRIVSHPALTSTGGTLVVRMDEPLVTAVTASTTTIELMESPYYCILADLAGGDYVSYIGIPACQMAALDYGWIQTWGPCWATSNSNTCNSAADRTIVFVGNGSVVSSDDVTVESGFQIAGFALDKSSNGGSNAPFIMLQLGR